MNISVSPPVNQPVETAAIAEIPCPHPQAMGFTEAFLRFSVQVLDDALQRATASDVLPPLTYTFEEEVAAWWVANNSADLKPYKPEKPFGAPQVTVDALVYDLRTQGMAALESNRGRISQLSKPQRDDVVRRLHALRPKYPQITDALIVRIGRGN